MTGRRSAMLGVLVFGFGGVWMTGACGSSEPSEAGSLGSGLEPPDPTAEVSLAIKSKFPLSKRATLGLKVPPDPLRCLDVAKVEPCMRYRIPLLGNPTDDVALRNKYEAAFGIACYMSEGPNATFDCFYKEAEMKPKGKACMDAQRIPEVFGAAPYDKGYECQKVEGTKDWWLQVGPDPAIKIDITYKDAPLETSLIDVNGVPTAVSGPYRNLPEPATVKAGGRFNCYYIDGVVQTERILQVNRKAHDGVIHSDLAGFTWPCNEQDKPICTEETELKAASENDPNAARVHHVVRKTDLRGCRWGTNSNKNAAVISRKLNGYLHNKYPTKEEVEQINAVPPNTP